MTEFALARNGEANWKLVKWDGETETQIGTGWDHNPSLEECLEALMNHHGTGNSPFSSRSGAVDAHLLSEAWRVPIRDLTLSDESLPWQ